MSGTARRWLLATCGVAVIVLSVHLAGQLAQASAWADVGAEVRESVRPRPGGWRLLRGTLHFLEIPALLALGTAIGYAVWRRDRRAAVTFAGVLLATNLLTQGIKHGPVSTPSGLNPLSGHVGLAAGLGCAWVLIGLGLETRWRRVSLGGAALVVAGTGGAVLLTGWHTLPQVLAPIGIAAGCALIAGSASPPHLPALTTGRAGFWMVLVGLALGVGAVWGGGSIASAEASRVGPAIALLLAVVVAATTVALGLVGFCAGFFRGGAPADATADQRR